MHPPQILGEISNADREQAYFCMTIAVLLTLYAAYAAAQNDLRHFPPHE